jgi:hypothetical protein
MMYTSSRREKRLVLVLSSSLDMTGELADHCNQRKFNGVDRSLVTDLRSAEKFEQSHLSSREVAPLVEAAEFFYIEGYFLTHGTESVLELGEKASRAGKARPN